ncbi:putative cell cycle sequence binding phosphoprotein (RBP33) [Trypanosoma rangeli]|uniref:Putative cell cycle sequence binding phosphoprotein (RBP33) n=1 Tax=Trypanosoma rangeli TaxID=5698 RepID=A0A3R7LKP3_TRYRA|nr:putative cell cycle sequence binding phosphoprotein (RBP33) [Trypanosoma rangeli]RNE99150.1 putative cell cycle sequence binding phosphoprotein (RBP33) [Trypanosoma rangeli]|eukprot:RNE99150.1 putative cell cycle sequence binding phosphoprotein (RBP33) [Trypanosoma rangeli]
MTTTDVNGSEDILDGFFSRLSLPFKPSGGSSGAPWNNERQKRQLQTSEALQPRTPNNTSLDAVTIPSKSSSGVGGLKDGVAHPGSASAGVSAHGGVNPLEMHTTSPISSAPQNQGYVMAPSKYTTALVQPPQLQHSMQQYPIPMPSTTITPQATTAQAEDVPGSDASRPALMPGKEVMLERLMACLGESKGMAALQLGIAQAIAPSSPSVAVLRQVIEHLEGDIEQLLQLRDMSAASNLMNVEAARDFFTNSELQLPNHQYRHQQQHQQLHQLTDASGAPLFGAPAQAAATVAAAPLCDQGLWCLPESRNDSIKNGSRKLADVPGATAMKRQQQQPYQQLETTITPPSGHISPYGGEGVVSTTQVYPITHSSYIASGEDPSAAYTASAETGHNFIETSAVGRGRGHVGALSGPPHRPVDPPTSAEGELVSTFLAFVEFKRHRVRKYECNIDISPGRYVMVDGDRGKDCGLLVQTIKTLPDGSTTSFCMDGTYIIPDKIKLEKGRVLGLATEEETTYLHNTVQHSERVALETCRRVCAEMGINLTPQDCEYQFDMEKVSFYFNSEHSVDFRPLVRELYRMFRVRIWMENTNPNVKNAMPITDAGGNGNDEDFAAVSEGTASNYNPYHHSRRHGGGAGPDAMGEDNSNGNGAGRRRGQRRGQQKHSQRKDNRK